VFFNDQAALIGIERVQYTSSFYKDFSYDMFLVVPRGYSILVRGVQ